MNTLFNKTMIEKPRCLRRQKFLGGNHAVSWKSPKAAARGDNVGGAALFKEEKKLSKQLGTKTVVKDGAGCFFVSVGS